MKRKRTATVMAMSLILVLGVEIFLRVAFGLGNPPLIVREEGPGYRFRPDQNLRRFGKRVAYNPEGLRSESIRKSDVDRTLILCLGDSVTNGGAITDQSDTYPYQLEVELAVSGLNVQVVNASAGGWAPSNEAGFIHNHGLFGAKYVVWELGTHDLYGGHAELAPGDPNFPEENPISATGELLSVYLLPRLMRRLKDDSPVPVTPSVAVDRGAFLRLVDSTAARVRSGGAKLVFLLMPEPREFDEPEYGAVAKRDFLEVARRLAIPVIDPFPELRASHSRGVNPFRDAIHPNPIGNRIMAKAVAAYLRGTGIRSGLASPAR